jgi:DNA polymerase III alpha subunit
MMFLSLEDLSGMLDVVIFPDAYRLARNALGSGQPLLITGIIERDDSTGEPLLKAEKITALE